MSLSGTRLLWIIVGVGTAARIVWAFATYGHFFDVGSYAIVHDALGTDLLRVYSNVTFDVGGGVELYRWPYPPLFMGWIAASGGLEDLTGLPFHGLIQLPAIAADAALALLVYWFLGRRGASDRICLLAAALVALGPPFLVVSGYHGQIDSLAILPAVAALIIWEHAPSRRALAAGLLIGVGAAIKTVPGLMILALLPGARDRREALILVAAAVAVPAILLAPFTLADPGGVKAVFDYNGAPGLGGLSLVLQPDLAADWLTSDRLHLSAVSEWLVDLKGLPSLAALAAAGLFLLRYRPAAVDAAVFVWLVVYAFSPNQFLQYAIWGLPFLLLAGYVRTVLLAELWLLAPFVIVYSTVWESREIALVYSPLMIGLWAFALTGVVVLGRRMVLGRRRHPHGVQPPLVSFEGPAPGAAPAPSRTAADTS